MRIGFYGEAEDKPEIRAGFIGCGSHSFRNIYPTFQFAPVNLVAVCDFDIERAKLFASKFGAEQAYSDYHEMLEKENLDAVFVVVGYDKTGHPIYPKIAIDCMRAGCHVWIEKPPAASCKDISDMQAVEKETGKQTAVGLKKMFFPANEKAKELSMSEDFGKVGYVSIQYPQWTPEKEQMEAYLNGEFSEEGRDFCDHLCHPASLLIYLCGMPDSLYYERSVTAAASLVFTYKSGLVANIALTKGMSCNAGMERTMIVSDNSRHIIVDNNISLKYLKDPENLLYGKTETFFKGESAGSIWEPEFSLGQLYNKGIFLLGYYNEINEFANAVLENRLVDRGGLSDAMKVTRIFEAFAKGPGTKIIF